MSKKYIILPPRWSKIWRDLWGHKSRTILVIMSIAIGIMAVGTLGQAYAVLLKGMEKSYEMGQPSEISLITEIFDRGIAQSIQKIPGVEKVEARRNITSRINPTVIPGKQPDEKDWKSLQILAINNHSLLHINKFYPLNGNWPLDRNGIWLERSALEFLQLKVGEEVWIDLPNGMVKKMHIVGSVYNPLEATNFSGVSYAYISFHLLHNLGLTTDYNTIYISASQSNKQLQNLSIKIRDQFKKNDIAVFSIDINEQGKHWAYDIVTTITFLLEMFGLLCLILGSFLITKTISSVFINQKKELAIMKVLGATTSTLNGMYIVYTLILGIIACLVSIPLSIWLSKLITSESMHLLNFAKIDYFISWKWIFLQLGLGTLIPIISALIPILSISRMTEQNAFSGHDFVRGHGEFFINKMIQKLIILPRPILLSIRNTVRRKGRFVLILATLSIGGAIIISVFNIQESIQLTVKNLYKYTSYDFRLTYHKPETLKKVEQIARQNPNVIGVESNYSSIVSRMRPDGTTGLENSLLSSPIHSEFIKPKIIKGHWLKSSEKQEIVINSELLLQEPDLQVGDRISLNINDKKTSWEIVGIALAPKGFNYFVNYKTYTELINMEDLATVLNVKVKSQETSDHKKIATKVKESLEDEGIHVGAPVIIDDVRGIEQARFNLVLTFLKVMGVLLMIVSGISLIGTLGLNVMERKKEIGIMQSMGATNQEVMKMVIVEALTIGIISFLFAMLMAYPISLAISHQVGTTLLNSPLDFVFSWKGVGIWFIAVMFLSVLSSFIPARTAIRLSLKDVLYTE